MCLQLEKIAYRQTASEDIICYKRLHFAEKRTITENMFISYDNHEFVGLIKHYYCTGKIRVENGHVYFCTNESGLDGMPCIDKLGYSYSWKVDYSVRCIYLVKFGLNDLPLMTPYRHAEVKLGETYTSELIHRRDDTINIGLHSYVKYEDAKYDGHGIIAKCIIPKGSEYYEGTFGVYGSYASNRLKYIEIVKY